MQIEGHDVGGCESALRQAGQEQLVDEGRPWIGIAKIRIGAAARNGGRPHLLFFIGIPREKPLLQLSTFLLENKHACENTESHYVNV
jgi:hypothetical protein